ncbi:MAG: hypothetical protein ABIQ75_05935 [Flavobacteriales bacterium]
MLDRVEVCGMLVRRIVVPTGGLLRRSGVTIMVTGPVDLAQPHDDGRALAALIPHCDQKDHLRKEK